VVLMNITLVAMAGIMSPGPDFIAVVYTSLSQTKRQAYSLAMGIVLGNVFWAAVAILGVGVLFSWFPMLSNGAKALGALFLLYFSGILIKSSRQPVGTYSDPELNASLTAGFLITLLNPKAALFYISILSALIPAGSTFFTLIAVVIIVLLISVTWFSVVIIFLSKPYAQKIFSKYKAFLEMFFAIFLLIYGFAILKSFIQ
jgi:threonine efflux protein